MSENNEEKPQKHQHRLVSHSYHHHDKCGMSELDAVLFHIIHLSRLTAGCRRSYAAEKEPYKRILQTPSHGYLLLEDLQHILDYHGLSRNKEEHTEHSDDQPDLVRIGYKIHDLGKLLILEKQPVGKKADHQDEQYI